MADVLLDACCLINIFSGGRAAEILQSVPHTWYVCEAVSEETLYVEVATAEQRERRQVEIQPLVSQGIIIQCAPSNEAEFAAVVHYAAHLDDGEAMCLALAKCRSWTVATDERKGRRIASEDGIPIINTPQLLRAWADKQLVSPQDVRAVVERITTLGRYRPGADAPEAAWWRNSGGLLR
jgi:predicted nucleic acid-binding protein